MSRPRRVAEGRKWKMDSCGAASIVYFEGKQYALSQLIDEAFQSRTRISELEGWLDASVDRVAELERQLEMERKLTASQCNREATIRAEEREKLQTALREQGFAIAANFIRGLEEIDAF